MPTTQQVWSAWQARSSDIAQWVLMRLCEGRRQWRIVDREPSPDPLTLTTLMNVYSQRKRVYAIEIEAASGGEGQWVLIGLDRTIDGEAALPGKRFDAALTWYEKLVDLGLDPLLEDSDGAGGYRLWVMLDEPLSIAELHGFAEKLTTDFGHFELMGPPHITPGGRGDGFVRLPGMHPDQQFVSRLWDGNRWLDGEAAVERLVSTRSSRAQLLRNPRPKRNAAVDVLPSVPGHAIETTPLRASRHSHRVNHSTPPAASATPPRVVMEATGSHRSHESGGTSQPPLVNPASTLPHGPVDVQADEQANSGKEHAAMPLADLFANPRVESQQPKAPSASAQSQATGEGQAKNSGKDREALSGGAGDMRSEPASRVTRIPATVLKTLADRTGMREEEIARRVFEWLTDQDEVVQALVLGLIPEALRDHALKLAIEQLAGRQRRVREAGAA